MIRNGKDDAMGVENIVQNGWMAYGGGTAQYVIVWDGTDHLRIAHII